jgi:hypothetical protein
VVNRPSRIALLPFGLLTLSALALEVFLTRVLAYTVHVLLIYFVLGVALLGFGGAGSLVALRPAWLEPARARKLAAWWSLGFSFAIVLSFAVFARIAPTLPGAVGWLTLLASTLLTLPFLAAGVVVTLALSSAGEDVGRVYAADLLGSGLGCFLPLVLLGPLTGEGFIGLLALLAWISAAGFAYRAERGRALRFALVAGLGPVLLAIAAAPRAFPFVPEPYGQLASIDEFGRQQGFSRETIWSRWNPVGRIGVHRFEGIADAPDPYPVLFFTQDNSSGALMLPWDGRDRAADPADAEDSSDVACLCSETLFGQAYFAPRSQVLVIGVGGGADVQCALYHGADHVDAVEINADSIRIVRGPFDHHLGDIGSDARVSYHVRDGRSFAHGRRDGSYGVIQLSGAETKQFLAAGALALNENTLHTREAFIDYLTSLRPDGVLSVIRFGQAQGLRVADTAVAALRELGEEHPEKHIVAIQSGQAIGVLVRRTPFPDEELDALEHLLWPGDRPFRGVPVLYLEPFDYLTDRAPTPLYTPRHALHPLWAKFFQHVVDHRIPAFERAYPAAIHPVDDDRPFFFDMTRYDLPGAAQAPHLVALHWLVGSILALAVLLIAAPLLWIRGRPRGRALPTALVYFAGVGLAYLLIEVWLIHRFGMFLGHQSYSLSVVLATLLVATGAGAVVGERWLPDPGRRALAGVTCVLVLLAFDRMALPVLLEALWSGSLAVRAAFAVAFVAPIGFAMGFPFPAGLRWVGARYASAIPWCCGINFFASVLASAIAIPLALVWGYSTIFAIGAACYGAVGLAALSMDGAPSSDGGS